MKEEREESEIINEKSTPKTTPVITLNNLIKIFAISALILINIALGTYLYKEFFGRKSIKQETNKQDIDSYIRQEDSSKNKNSILRNTSTPTIKPTKKPTMKLLSEDEEIYNAARNYLESQNNVDYEYTLKILKKTDKYALVEIMPWGDEVEGASIILQKINGIWIGQTMGTYFEDWYDIVPELFNF